MNQKFSTCIAPKYMTKFRCIGGACEDTCCIGWQVSIDKKTFQRYRKVTNRDLHKKLTKHVKRHRSQTSESKYAKIVLDQGNVCPFLDEKKLCEIQRNLGEEYLSHTCSYYPRVHNTMNGILELSATLSCPEVARKALLDADSMEFVEMEGAQQYGQINSNISLPEIKSPQSLLTYYWDLRTITIHMLSNRTFTVSERLLLLGILFQKLQTLQDEKKLNQIPELLESFRDQINRGIYDNAFDQIPSFANVQVLILKHLADIRVKQGIHHDRYRQCLKEFLIGLEVTIDTTLEEVVERYEFAYENYYQPYMAAKEHILENYLINYVFKNMFPMIGSKNIFDHYLQLTLHYSLLKLHAIGMSRYHKGFTDELMVMLVQSFAKTVEHNPRYVNDIMKVLTENGYNKLAHVAILIKN